MENIESFSSDIDLRDLEKKYEDFDVGDGDMEMIDDEVDVGFEEFEVVACCSNIDPVTIVVEEREMVYGGKEDSERKVKRWLARRQSPENRRTFMEDLCRYWPEFGVLLEYEIEESAREVRFDVACPVHIVSNSEDELDPVAIRKSPVIVRWFMGKLSKYWPGFGLTDEDNY